MLDCLEYCASFCFSASYALFCLVAVSLVLFFSDVVHIGRGCTLKKIVHTNVFLCRTECLQTTFQGYSSIKEV